MLKQVNNQIDNVNNIEKLIPYKIMNQVFYIISLLCKALS